MIINKFVFPIKADKTFVSGALPQGYLTANDINKDMFYVLSPSVGATIIKARFQNDKQSEPAVIVDMLATDIDIKMLVDENASYYDLVKDWNVWQGYFPSKALEYVSYNRAGKIGISFMLKQSILPPLPQLEFKGKLVSQDDKVLENGYYIVDTPLYEIDGNSLTFNDVIIKNDNDIIIRKSIVQSGNTGTVEYGVDPSVYGGVDESIDITLTESIIDKVNDNTNEIKYIKLMFDNYYEKDETYNRDEIDNLFEDVNLEIVDLKDDITRIDIKDTEQDLRLNNIDNNITNLEEDITRIDIKDTEQDAELVRLDDVKIEQGALNGFVFQPTWDKNKHILTLNMQGYPPLVIDLPSEFAFRNIRVEGDDLILTREDGTEVVVSLSGLLNGMASEEWVNTNFYDKLETNTLLNNKQDKLVAGENVTIEDNVISASGGIDLDEIVYINYASEIFYKAGKQNQFKSAWEHSLTVDPLEISGISTTVNKRGTAQYPNGETEGVIIPQGITSIGDYAFWSWTSNNKPLVIPDSVTSISVNAFYNWTSNNQPLVIPKSITNIGDYVFGSWTSNNKPLVIPDSVTSISVNAFVNWTSNNQPLVIGNSVTSIGDHAFRGWRANTHPLVIPDSVTSIGSVTFNGWANVPYIIMEREVPPTLANANAFGGQNDVPIYVPDGSVTAYKTTPQWVDLADRIFPISKKDTKLDDYYNKDELDSKFDDKVDNVDLERANKRVNELERELREIGSDSEVISKSGYEIDLGVNAIGNVKVDMLAGGKNLGGPDLTGKEYLGNGVYRLSNKVGLTFDYDVYSGYYSINGTLTTSRDFIVFDLIPQTSMLTYYFVSGSFSNVNNIAFNNYNKYNWLMVYANEQNDDKSTSTNDIILGDKLSISATGGSIFDNFTFKLQIEKGSTATDYEVPYINATTLKRLSIQNSTINLAGPDLTGKEYLGNGIYRLSEVMGITIDYNVFNGDYEINGTLTIVGDIVLFDLIPDTSMLKYYYINGTFSNGTNIAFNNYLKYNWLVITEGYQNDNASSYRDDIVLGDRFSISLGTAGMTFDNFVFKLQIEKGTTATPYVIPIFNENNIHSELFIKPKIQLQANDIITYNKGNFLLNDTILNTSGLLVAQPNTKLVIENITNEVNTYGNELLYNIVSIKKLLKINQDGTETPIDLSTITINDNTFTTTQLNNNDLFYIVYEFETIESGLKAFASYYNSDKIIIDETTDKVYKWKVKINNGVPELIATEVE